MKKPNNNANKNKYNAIKNINILTPPIIVNYKYNFHTSTYSLVPSLTTTTRCIFGMILLYYPLIFNILNKRCKK